jgi:hypothetical protein
MHANVSILEAIWTIAAMIGLMVQVVLLASAIGDLNALKRTQQNGERRIIAWQNIRNEAVRLILQSVFVWIGLVASSLPPRMPSRGGGVLTSVIIPLIYISVVVMISASSILDFRDRRTLVDRLTLKQANWNGVERRSD